MLNLKIIRPEYKFVDMLIDMCLEYEKCDDFSYPYTTKEKAISKIKNDIQYEKGILHNGRLQSFQYWFVNRENKIVGTSRLRPVLNDAFLFIGGNIGYDISPLYRNKGYGKEVLRLILLEAKKKDLKKVLITCDENNIASWKIIEANNGVLENTVLDDRNNEKVRRYWIELA